MNKSKCSVKQVKKSCKFAYVLCARPLMYLLMHNDEIDTVYFIRPLIKIQKWPWFYYCKMLFMIYLRKVQMSNQ